MPKVYNLIKIFLIVLLTVSFPLNSIVTKPDKDNKIMFKAGELLIKLNKGIQINSINNELNSKNFKVKKHFINISKLHGQDIYLIKTDSDSLNQSESSITSQILNIKGIESISLNYAKTADTIPNDPLFYQQWALNNTGQKYFGYGNTTGTDGIDVNAPEIWNISKGNPDVVIAVLDSGIDYLHEDLKSSMWKNTGEIPDNGIDDDGNGYKDDYYGYDFASNENGDNDSDPMDLSSINHGTHVAGIIAASQNNIGVSGLAPGVKLMALKAFRPNGYIYTSDEVEALGYIVMMKSRGVNIVAVNCSFGGESSSSFEKDAYQLVGEAGIIITCSAGNGDDDGNPVNNDTTPHFPSSYEVPNLLSIAATDSNGILGDFSNFGSSTVDMGAPGVAVRSTVMTGTGADPGTVNVNGTKYIVFQMTYSKFTNGITGTIYNCAKGLSSSDFPLSVSGNIALIERGDATFAEKTTNAKNAGAIGVIIYNKEPGTFSGTLGSEGNWPVVVSISREDGLILKNLETSNITLISSTISNYEFKNGTSMSSPYVAGAVGLIASIYQSDTIQKRYLRTLFCGKLNDDLSLKSKIGISLDLNSLLIQPVLGLTGQRVKNRSLLQTQYLDVITWQKNSQNSAHNISKYNLYKIDDNDLVFLESLSSDTTSYNNDDVSKTKSYSYVIVPVSAANVLGEPSVIFVSKD